MALLYQKKQHKIQSLFYVPLFKNTSVETIVAFATKYKQTNRREYLHTPVRCLQLDY